MALSDVSIETHIAPTASKSLGAAVDDDAKAVAGAETLPTAQVDARALAPMRTIANAVLSLASQATTGSSAVQVPDDISAAVPTAARTMTLQLSPEHLGTVDVRLHVTGQTLDVQLSLSDQQTLGLVSRERDALASALRNQNYDLHTLVIQSTDGSTGASGDQYVPNQGAGGGDSNGGWSPSENREGTGQQAWTGSNQQPGRQGARDGTGIADGGPQSGGGDLFV